MADARDHKAAKNPSLFDLNGRSEQLMGLALQDRRDKAFLITRVCTHGRDRKVAMQQLEQSLRRQTW